MKIVFQDFDGVLNSMESQEKLQAKLAAEGKPYATMYSIDPEAVARLNSLISFGKEEHGEEVVLVISSSWRKLLGRTGLQEVLGNAGFEGTVYDVTPDLSREPRTSDKKIERGHEIEKWVQDNEPDAIFVIFDDDSDMGNLHHRFIQTTWSKGLQDEHIARARELLWPA